MYVFYLFCAHVGNSQWHTFQAVLKSQVCNEKNNAQNKNKSTEFKTSLYVKYSKRTRCS